MKLTHIRNVLIVGGGTMGQQIGFQCAAHGCDVITDAAMNHSFWVWVYPGLTEEMIAYVIDVFTRFVRGR